MMRSIAAAVPAIIALSLPIGCSDSGNAVKGNLIRFSSCAEMKEYILTTAKPHPPAVGFSPMPGSEALAAPEYSDTNVQEAGVDEPDFVKTDGNYIYIASGGYFLILKSWPPMETAEVSRYKLEGTPVSLFIKGETAVVFTDIWETSPLPLQSSSVKATVLNIKDRTSPRLLREIYLEGYLSGARMVDGRVYMVVSYPVYFWTEPSGIEPAIGDVFPEVLDVRYTDGSSASESDIICPCEDVYRPEEITGNYVITIYGLNLDDPLGETKSVSVLGDSGIIYGSEENLFIASSNWASSNWTAEPLLEGGSNESTSVHRFTLGTEAAYAGSGVVNGWVLNQFSMSEYKGYLRIATTSENWQTMDPENAVYTLALEEGRLSVKGSVTGLGKPGERIYGVRFLGDKGFVVTYERKDPLYTLDLSDPLHPKKVGELEVPGFSTYLHPLDEGHILAIGRNDDNRGVDLSIFDIGDFANPRLVARQNVAAESYSEAEYEHKAFVYYPALKALALPVTIWGGAFFNGAYIYTVDANAGFAYRGSIDHTEFYKDETKNLWYYPAHISRSIFMGDGQYYIYTISSRGLKATEYADLTKDVASVELPAEDIYWLQ